MEVAALDNRINIIEFQDQPAIAHLFTCYFDTLNQQQFHQTASLFADDGVLIPPFDEAMVGPEAIANYLETEAKGLQLFPQHYSTKTFGKDQYKCRVGGKVQTPIFSVNVCWDFQLNSSLQIKSVKVNLLASMEELLKLKK